MEEPPSRVKREVLLAAPAPPARMEIALRHDTAEGIAADDRLAALRPGDVIAFHMSHREAWRHLRRGGIQKIPYELFRYGHIALVVPGGGDLRLLQVAMKQAVNADEGVAYLRGKSWIAYRPPAGAVDAARLAEFAERVTAVAADPRQAYDYSGALGISNAPWLPAESSAIGDEYTCATLVVAGLHYAGFHLHAVHRRGKLDVVTPRQVVESFGTRR